MAPLVVNADITHGLASDFQDMTTQGWSGGAAPANTAGGQGGPDDFFLEIFGGGNVATYNLRPEYSGVLDGSVLTL